MVKAGRVPKHPPLRAFCEQTEKRIKRRQSKKDESGRSALIKLSKLQKDFLKNVLQELSIAGVETTQCELAYDGIRSIDAALAAHILILVQNRYEKWIKEGSNAVRSRTGIFQSISGLVTKLLPLAKDQIVLFQREDRQSEYDPGPIITLRLSSQLQQRVAHLCLLAYENRLPYVTSELKGSDFAWSVRYVDTPGSCASVNTLLCVSNQDIWLQCEVRRIWDSRPDRFDTVHLPIQQLVPAELLPKSKIELPAVVPQVKVRPFADRLRALKKVEHIYDSLVATLYDMERGIPDDRLALADRLWFGEGDSGPFLSARRAWRKMEERLEIWEMSLEAEKAELCRDVLGIEKGDIVILKSQGQMVRTRIDGASIYLYDSEMCFRIWGTRFRKDGTLGKRQDSFLLHVENDAK